MATFTNKFKSIKQDWTTPDIFFKRLDNEFHFTIDLAASESNAKVGHYYGSETDALQMPWTGVGWLNPPYGAKTGKLSDWVKRGYEQTNEHKSTVVMFIPARTNTRWFHSYCMKAQELRFIDGRPKFGDAKHGLPQPLVLVVFGPNNGTPKVSSYRA